MNDFISGSMEVFTASVDFIALSQAFYFLSDPGLPGVRSMGPGLCLSVTPTPFADLTDVTLAGKDTNSILAYHTNREIPGNLEMQMRKSSLVRKSYLVRTIYLVRKSYLGNSGSSKDYEILLFTSFLDCCGARLSDDT